MLSLLALLPLVLGQTSEELPDGDVLFDRALEALGGVKELAKVESVRVVITKEVPGLGSVRTEVCTGPPTSFFVKKEHGPVFVREWNPKTGEERQRGACGDVYWVREKDKPRIVEGKDVLGLLTDANLSNLVWAQKHQYSEKVTEGRETFDGRPCWRVRVRGEGVPEQFAFFDVETGRMAGNRAESGSRSVSVYYRNWKKVGKLSFYTEVSIEHELGKFVMHIGEIELGKVDPALFELPADVRALNE